MKSQPRPSHADYTYHAKYGTHSSSGGGRSSARETIGRVAAGAVAEKWLYDRFGIEIVAWVLKPSCLLLHNFSLFVSFLSFPFFPFRSIPLSASIVLIFHFFLLLLPFFLSPPLRLLQRSYLGRLQDASYAAFESESKSRRMKRLGVSKSTIPSGVLVNGRRQGGGTKAVPAVTGVRVQPTSVSYRVGTKLDRLHYADLRVHTVECDDVIALWNE